MISNKVQLPTLITLVIKWVMQTVFVNRWPEIYQKLLELSFYTEVRWIFSLTAWPVYFCTIHIFHTSTRQSCSIHEILSLKKQITTNPQSFYSVRLQYWQYYTREWWTFLTHRRQNIRLHCFMYNKHKKKTKQSFQEQSKRLENIIKTPNLYFNFVLAVCKRSKGIIKLLSYN